MSISAGFTAEEIQSVVHEEARVPAARVRLNEIAATRPGPAAAARPDPLGPRSAGPDAGPGSPGNLRQHTGPSSLEREDGPARTGLGEVLT